ncbi:BppU family phage baseplate upper protein [Bacteroides sp.]|uniref:BppU family phage baseplate upper protein n=1 Tax=Bacteroides sp. TaxID=29523 RepID=UPI00261652FC|nr:BppU family phage baseplate upper protein [Bacteroides sp.]MDD3041088.1 BppU family phage baseplate upper protein [Bacteroides sp.]
MAQTYNRLLIDVNQKINNIVTAKQNDTASRFLDVSLYSNGVPINLTGHSVKIYFKKPDSTEVFTEGEVTDATTGRCQFELTSQTLAVYGDLKAEITIWNGSTEVLSTQTFTICVLEMLRSDNAIESTNEFGVLVTLFQSIQNSLELMNVIKTNFGEAGEKAAEYEATTFWEMLEGLADKTEEAIQLDVSGKIGEPTDTTGGTVFGNMAVAKIGIESTVNAHVTDEITDLQTHIDGLSNIKSIQRGVVTVNNGGTTTFTISSVNPAKCQVVLNGMGKTSGGDICVPYLFSLTETFLTIKLSSDGANVTTSYQVIEFN